MVSIVFLNHSKTLLELWPLVTCRYYLSSSSLGAHLTLNNVTVQVIFKG